MNNKSWRHHYIPQFYLKGFTNKNGTFKIYDVERERFIKSGKEFYPESYFFEKDGNALNIENKTDDFIETKFFKDIDNLVSGLFERIKSSNENDRYGVSEKDMPLLQYFVSILFWRLPSNYDKIKYLIKTKDLHDLGLLIKNRKGETVKNEELENRLLKEPDFYKVIKFWLPHLTYNRLLACKTPLTIKSFHNQFPSLCSDNPVIFQNSEMPDLYYDDFIFPLTNDLIFIRGNKINRVLT